MSLVELFQWLRIDEVFGEKADVVNVGSDRFLREAGLLKPGAEFVKDGLVVGSDGSNLGIVGGGVGHLFSFPCREL